MRPKNDTGVARDKRQERRSYRAERERARELNSVHTKSKNCKTNASHVNREATKQTLLAQNGKLVKIVNELLTESQHHDINDLINVGFIDLFATSSKPSQVLNVKHVIDTGSAKPVNRAPYRTGPKEREIIQVQVESMLNDNIIRKSKSPWASGIVLVRKKDGSVRFCLDYRKLNSLTVRDVYPLPRIDDSLAALQKGVFFSTLDMNAGYWQIPMDEASKEKTAFITEGGLFEYHVVWFDQCSSHDPTLHGRHSGGVEVAMLTSLPGRHNYLFAHF
jgi:hypothetical protein